MSDSAPTFEEFQRVRRHECTKNGHDWDAFMVSGREDPVAFVCSHCGRRVSVVSPELPRLIAAEAYEASQLLDYLHRRRDAAERILESTESLYLGKAYDDVIAWLADHGVSR